MPKWRDLSTLEYLERCKNPERCMTVCRPCMVGSRFLHNVTQHSANMRKVVSITCVMMLIGACQSKGFSDEEKIAALEKLCKESASENIVEKSADGSVLLSEGAVFGLSGWSVSTDILKDDREPVGSARLPVLDLEYSPRHLLRNLFRGNHSLGEVIFTRGPTGTNSPVPAECQTTHMLSIRSRADSEAAFLNVCDVNQLVKSIDNTRYHIGRAYGDLDDHEIRRFVFYVRDRESGRILAEQRSYQLLMGGMKSKESRVLHGWGSSQGVMSCGLTPPDQLVKRVFY